MGGWGSVTEASQDLDPGVTHTGEKAPLFSEWQVRNLAGKSESLGRKTLFGINKPPCHKAPPTPTVSVPGILMSQDLLFRGWGVVRRDFLIREGLSFWD